MYASIRSPLFERERHIAAIVEGLFERLAQVFVAGQLRNPALQILVLQCPEQFPAPPPAPRVFQHFSAHALVSSSECTWLLQSARVARGACVRPLIQLLQRVLVLVAAEVPLDHAPETLSVRKPSITAVGS